MCRKVKYLVRRLTVTYDGGKEEIFPLVVVSAFRDGDKLESLETVSFRMETPGTEYVSEMWLRQISATCFIIDRLRI
ncbi:MAG: hypothetical protein K2G52_04610 [Muribaculaceae bacterium]|nr:hypothetical protein [Muribaculaceae bacterium]